LRRFSRRTLSQRRLDAAVDEPPHRFGPGWRVVLPGRPRIKRGKLTWGKLYEYAD
jgi:hypothetical protein